MKKLKILNKKEIKKILKQIEKQFNCSPDLDYAFLLRPKDNKIFLINKEFAEIDDSKLRINSLGLYFAELRNNQLRLSIEGSQIIGPIAKKNVIEISWGLTRLWLHGHDIEYGTDIQDYVIIKHKKDYMGCGKPKDDKILNHVPKIRRLTSKD